MAVHLSFEIRFRFGSGFHITGDRIELWTDKAVVLDWNEDKNPVIPATTIKGWMRENSERILRSIGKNACDGSQASTICGSCLVCQFFGYPGAKARIRFEDAILKDAIIDTRTGVSLSRFRKTAYEERLFTMEVVWAPSFVIKGDGFFTVPEEAEKAATLLWLAAKLGFAIGSSRSRGLGWLEFEDFFAQCNGKDIGLERLRRTLNSWRGEESA